MKKETLSCPFCGSEQTHILSDWSQHTFYVHCDECGARSRPCLYGKHKLPIEGIRFTGNNAYEMAREAAINAWNNRA